MLGRLSAVTADGAWPKDATLRGMELIRRSVTSVMETAEPGDRRLVIFGLSALQTRYGARSGRLFGADGGPAYDLLSASLDGGRALRLFVPGLQSVVFVDDALPSDTGATLYVREAGERLERMGRGAEARDRLRRWIESQATPIDPRGGLRRDPTSVGGSAPR
jgi:hypothetical protein